MVERQADYFAVRHKSLDALSVLGEKLSRAKAWLEYTAALQASLNSSRLRSSCCKMSSLREDAHETCQSEDSAALQRSDLHPTLSMRAVALWHAVEEQEAMRA